MAKSYYTICLVGAMDQLWFCHAVLGSQPVSASLLTPNNSTIKEPQPIPKFPSCPSSTMSPLSPLPDEEIQSPVTHLTDEDISSDSSSFTLQADSNNEEEEDEGQEEQGKQKERPTRLNLDSNSSGRARYHSSSPSTQQRPKRLKHSVPMGRLSKSMSCRTLEDLELEEVKGFMDLGFIFKEEHLNPRIIRVIPGLQRLKAYNQKQRTHETELNKEQEVEEEEEEGEENRVRSRPYLSEAWNVRRPDSPLLNLRMPKVSSAADMKKHLRFWAKIVASEIQQES